MGIYQIKNLVNGKIYIGSSVDLKRRRKHHFVDLRRNVHHCKYLQRAWNKYGETKFKFEILEIVEETKQKMRDAWKIRKSKGVN